MEAFIPGATLARRLFEEAVRPLMAEHMPGVPYAAGLVGPGSDVLGYDTARSMDHDWGPRLVIVLSSDDLPAWGDRLGDVFREHLPSTIAGFPTRYGQFADDPGITYMAVDGATHRIRIMSHADLLRGLLGIDDASEIDAEFWLTVTGQQILEMTAGPVFHRRCGRAHGDPLGAHLVPG